MPHAPVPRARKSAFTLVELLVVIGIIALLISILMPALSKAREQAASAACMSNLRSIGQGFVMYGTDNKGYVIPSYTMTGAVGGATVPMEGWAAILDRDGYIKGKRQNDSSAFVCPSMSDIEGMRGGQTGLDPEKPKGWMDWPNVRLGTDNQPVTIPERGFNRIIRVGYWINADNPIGAATSFTPDLFYTCSVGYEGTNGVMRHQRSSRIKRPSQLIVLADGVYAGRQRDNRIGTENSRIGYRHGGKNPTANVAFADGHVEPIAGMSFPRAKGGSVTLDIARQDNLGSGPTVYANPEEALK